jgi:ABC-type multidrug transport system fused ATPase/permease subunit
MSLRKDNKEEKVKLTKATLIEAVGIFKYIKPYMGYFITAIVLIMMGSLIFMIFPGAAGEMANQAIGESKFSFTLKQYGLLFLVILILQGIFSYIRTVCFAIVSEKGMADLRKDLYTKMITQDFVFFEQQRVGELTSRITADVEQLQSAFSITLAEFIRQIIVLIVGVAILAYLTPKLSIIMLMTFPVIVVIAVIFGRYIRRLSRKRQDELANTNTIVEETFQSFSAVKSFTNEWYEAMRYGKSVDKIVKISLSFAKTRGLFFIFIITVLFGGIFFILWQGALLVEKGEMDVGHLFSFILYTGIMGGAIASLGNLYTALAGAVGATERIQSILKKESEIEIKGGYRPTNIRLRGDISFDNVSFRYPTRDDISVLDGVSFEVDAGQKVALVGQSGSGKSTIIKLLMKFYDVSSGVIRVDNRNITNFNLTDFRKNIGIVPQEVILFGGTIRENILYGKPDATEEEIINAAEMSNSLEFINSFPEKFETVVGERGIKLSGGQRQRIAIARAILKDPTILILDEATSSLDAESEKIVQDALNKLMMGRTSIIIAHRLATIKEVDCIYVIENGKIVEKGTHSQLSVSDNGPYSRLAKLQFELI